MTTRETKTPDEAFGANVAAARAIRGISQRELAEQLTAAGFRVDAPAVSRIEKGTRAVRLTEALIIADVLHVDISMMVSTLDLSPAAELRRLRRHATEAYHQLREPLLQFLQRYIWVYEHLLEHPELVKEVEIDGRTIDSPADYFRLATERISELEMIALQEDRRDAVADYAVYFDDVTNVGIRSVMGAYLDAVIVSPERQQQIEDAHWAPRYQRGESDGEATDAAE